MVPAPELSRPVPLDRLGGEPLRLTVVAEADERAALARRFGLLELNGLAADVELTRDGDRIHCAGTVRATVVQACVASGEPVPARVEDAFALRFLPPRPPSGDEEVELDDGDLDTVEYQGQSVDVGEAVAQTLALALEPFPRAPDADQALREAGVVGEEEMGPFAALRALRDRL